MDKLLIFFHLLCYIIASTGTPVVEFTVYIGI